MLDIKYLTETAKKLSEICSDTSTGFIAIRPLGGGEVHLTEDEFFRSFPKEKFATECMIFRDGRIEVFTIVDGVRFYAIIGV